MEVSHGMTQQQYDVQRPTGVCAATGRKLEEGEAIYTVLFEEGETFGREDYSLDGWKGAPKKSFCHFRSRVPVKTKRRRLFIDDEGLIAFFLRLADEPETLRVQFRFVLALLLMRKRLLKYEDARRTDDGETWRMILTRDQSRHLVLNPNLTDDQIEGVSKQLTAVLHGDMGEFADEIELEDEPGVEEDQA